MNASGHSGLCASLLSSVLVGAVDPRRLLGMVNVATTFVAGYPALPSPALCTHRAFVVGVNVYSGSGVGSLTKSVNDAEDVTRFVRALLALALWWFISLVMGWPRPRRSFLLPRTLSRVGGPRLVFVRSRRASVQVLAPTSFFRAVSSITGAPETWVRVNWMLYRLHMAAPTVAVTFFLDCCRQVSSVVPPYEPPVLVGGRYVVDGVAGASPALLD